MTASNSNTNQNLDADLDLKDLTNINLGIFGHIDHGKTTLSGVLTEIASTSSLDKLPESQKRGITIDMGFSSFNLKKEETNQNYMITLVDAPGHADLIKTVVSAADIIDIALIVVDAKEGPKTQTGEHLLILDNFNIPTIVVITKIDNANAEEIAQTKLFMNSILNSTQNLKNSEILEISAKNNLGIDNLKNSIMEHLLKLQNENKLNRKTDDYFKMPLDHAFPIKGAGTVITGTINKGIVKVGDELKILPINMETKVRSIQRFRKSVNEAEAGDRVGMALQNVEAKQIYRGCILTSKDTKLQMVDKIVAKVKISDIFRYNLTPKMTVHLNVGMLTVPAKVITYKKVINPQNNNTENLIVNQVGAGQECYCSFELDDKVLAEVGDRILITRLDLPPTTLRICGHGTIEGFESLKDLDIRKEVLRDGNIRIEKGRTTIENLAPSKSNAEKLIGEKVYVIDKSKNVEEIKKLLAEDSNKLDGSKEYTKRPEYIKAIGKLKGTFGTKGVLVADFDAEVGNRDVVLLKRLRRWG
ncbi:selenocysteine-specific translation elongation factor [Methanococcus voltae]|uniref:Selenocysteine-specific elongation factor n=1 Tax=Methanococcus voltae (strain ATCC BAA-1334 / A3) TaxID=456320 RepID=D7DT21_METV3|nr:selenocysteine-specific translation elongation factor [Methanococcus voltae]MCS3901943.1 selenocysteine-specific elongation factor [Methanococcus voltae]